MLYEVITTLLGCLERADHEEIPLVDRIAATVEDRFHVRDRLLDRNAPTRTSREAVITSYSIHYTKLYE